MNILKTLFKYLTGQQFTLYMDGGGGGGQSSTGTQTSISELPEWARGYAKSALEKGAALSEKPYQAYDQNRIAGFSPLQQQSQQGAANMQTNAGTGAGMNVAGLAALGGLSQNYQGGNFSGGQFGSPQAAQYMSPYIENAMQPQLREAQRSSDIMGQQNAAKAVGQGAFGGSRSGLVEAERQRNLGMQQGDIRAKGYQTAYEQAANQFNQDSSRGLQAQQLGEQSRQFGSNLGLQGLNTALQGAGQLGALGQQQFQQGMDINKLQNAYGGQQQALRQQGLSQAYEDFQNQQNYPYKQLGFMSDLVRGLPLGQVTSKSMYEPNPSALQQVGAAGAGLYGLSKFMADGGMAYADGGEVEGYDEGGSVDSQDNVDRIVSKLSDQQLQQAMQAAQARGDQDQLEAIQSEMAMRASERNGIASAVTPDMANQMAAAGGLMDSYAGGGILAFQSRGEVDSDAESNDRERYLESPGNKKYYDTAGSYAMDALERLRNRKAYQGLDRAGRDALEKETFERLQKYGGEDPYGPMAEKIKGFEEAAAKNYDRGLGFAALSAIPAILEGGNAMRGIGRGLGAFGTQAEQADRAAASERRGLAGLQFNLADAKRKERTALGREALSTVKDTEANRLAADAAERKALTDEVGGYSNLAKAYRPIKASGSGAGKEPKVAEQNYQNILADLRATSKPNEGESPKAFEARIAREASKLAVAEAKTFDAGPNRTSTANDAIAVKLKAAEIAELEKLRRKPDYRDATPTMKQIMEDQVKAEVARRVSFDGATPAPTGGNAGKLKFDMNGDPIK